MRTSTTTTTVTDHSSYDHTLLTRDEFLVLHARAFRQWKVPGKQTYDAEVIDKAAYELLMQHNCKLVAKLAIRYHKALPDGALLTREDLEQEGMIGLDRALRKFRNQGNEFSTYATWWIRQALSRAIGDQEDAIRVPIYQQRRAKGFRRQPLLSLDAPMGREDERLLGDTLPTPVPGPDDEDRLSRLDDQLANPVIARAGLTLREGFVLAHRNGLALDGRQQTLEEIGRQLHITRERVRQIEKGALTKLRQAHEALAREQSTGKHGKTSSKSKHTGRNSSKHSSKQAS